MVDIETEWNLKLPVTSLSSCRALVDIETEWNLKQMNTGGTLNVQLVDIETEWNLKNGAESWLEYVNYGRYRNRVEFKGG